MFRMQHLKQYDELCLQYLHRKAFSLNLPHETYQTFPPFEDRSENGFHGFVPSGQWLRDVYDMLIEQHQLILNQHTAMLSGHVCAIDHSHKLAKHVFKVDGVPIFTALLTVTNDKGEICVCVFVATKSHSQFTDALKKMSESLELYGHEQPEVFYMDNMSDKSMLEEIFQSLLADVVAVKKYADLPTFVIEDRVKISVLDSTASIDNAMRAIVDDVPHDGGYIVVGFDSEWNIETGHAGRVTRRGSTAVVQIAYEDNIYVLPIGDMLASGHIPQQLLSLLRDGQVLKAGHLVSGDLRQLETASGQQRNSFMEGIDLASFAKEHFLISNACISLADLTALLLKQCLPKNRAERISSNWSDRDLTEAQIQYAACDAHVSLCLFNEINKNPLPVLLSPDNPPGTPLIILNENHKKVVARGCLAMSSTAAVVDGINITSTRAVVEVHEVFVPGFTISQHRKRTLKSFGATPFDIVCHRGHIRATSVQLGPLHANATTSSTNANLHNNLQDIECSESHEEEESISLGDLLRQHEHDLDLESDSTDTSMPQQGTAAVDLASAELAESMGARELPVEAFARII
ncbi:ribonuclease H-like domain-containing protein [Armillaria novae-zelandiae]|uniref:Ribonuclease H-like domain-containing protein n=1 Tax=Armillaria novae-zelandiae TaxID=153914 RepID=A0AA39T3B3_9AGAR|nr:ribonuclease H-like domain-containing protein [Armillaria novae-zelandiae]